MRPNQEAASAVFVDRSVLLAAANLFIRIGGTHFSAISKASDILGRPGDLVDLDDATPLVRRFLGSGEPVRSHKLAIEIPLTDIFNKYRAKQGL